MAEQMNELQLMMQERMNTGTAWTRNEKFDKDGYLVVKDLWDPEELIIQFQNKKDSITIGIRTQNILIMFPLSNRQKVLHHVIGIHNIVRFTLVFV